MLIGGLLFLAGALINFTAVNISMLVIGRIPEMQSRNGLQPHALCSRAGRPEMLCDSCTVNPTVFPGPIPSVLRLIIISHRSKQHQIQLHGSVDIV
jgi:hypothetical protein